MDKSILIVGANGFIGANLAAYCLAMGMVVVGVDITKHSSNSDLHKFYPVDATSAAMNAVVDTWKPNYLVNAAGNANVGKSFEDPDLDFKMGPQLQINLLESIRRFSPDTKSLFISSAAVYGQPGELPIDEDTLIKPISPYGYHKWIGEILISEYVNLYALKANVIRVFSAYGNGLRKQILWDLCNKCKESNTITLSGTGMETRDFIHVDDICRAIMLILNTDEFDNQAINIGTGQETKISEIASILINFYDHSKCLEFSGKRRTGDPVNWRADISRLRRFGFNPQMDLASGVSNYVDWFKRINNDA